MSSFIQGGKTNIVTNIRIVVISETGESWVLTRKDYKENWKERQVSFNLGYMYINIYKQKNASSCTLKTCEFYYIFQ